MIRLLVFLTVLLATPALAELKLYPAIDGSGEARKVTVYSSLDEPLARPMIAAFQAANPDIAVAYEDLQTVDIFDRVVAETDAGGVTADFAFSSSMDLQVKLANDGYAQESDVPLAESWPRWANWRNTAYALTYEPAVFIYHKPSFAGTKPPSTRAELIQYLKTNADAIHGRIGTYDIERSGVGFMFFSRDQEQYSDLWTLVSAMGAAGVKLYSTTSAIVDRVADGRFVFGYNILGSYAAEAAARNPDLGIVLPADYTIVTSRIGLVPKAAANPELGRRYLEFFMSAEGQTIMAQQLQIAALNPDVTGDNTANAMQQALGNQLRPVPVSPGLMVYLDQVKRARLIRRWNDALSIQ
ncbi:ABC transporter substrate-binding protein [Devosia sp. ZB163]|uniref:ABC transporter substrate-binding protein n=1 Tax=Devosia sp. ZB163 TaxID=3025938 RepID=UPI0023629227|nr:ABC transporter substrate-binding protein [Devosia sp. ZB163]MDC9822269.1 ABC transporter substrate-binding protein [Devosia sp. ZB163]